MTAEQVRARPVPGRWSTLEVVCHLADAEVLYAEFMKRVIAEDEPSLHRAESAGWASRLAYQQHDLEEELHLIELVRSQMSRIFCSLKPVDYQRRGRHSTDGSLTLEDLLQRAIDHIPHHLRFIQEMRAALTRHRPTNGGGRGG
jgi:hypothetical protein